MRRVRAITALALLAAAGLEARALDLSGDLSLQTRAYPESPAFSGQRSSTVGGVLEPTLHGELTPATSFTFTPLYRHDSADSRRTHADLREAYLLTFGEWGGNSWQFRLGVDRVFWGVAEVHNLVDIVNQTDLVEHPRDRPKLGQPMIHLAVSGDWGLAESFLLPYHRKRTFPGRSGRLRAGRLIEDDAAYESGAKERHVDVAFRYSQAVGRLDLSLSAFSGTSREPFFRVDPGAGAAAGMDAPLLPYYEQIRQYGLEVQFTTEPVLFKMEAIRRHGAANLRGEAEDYGAFILGLERTLYTLFDSPYDLTVLGEWLYDERGSRATSAWQNDVYLTGFLAFNDVQGTELIAGLLADLRHNSRTLNLEFKRRLAGNWSMRLEAFANLDTDREDLTYDGRRDSFAGAELIFSF